jgi:hypothetical protein
MSHPSQYIRIAAAAAALKGILALRGTELLRSRLINGPTSPLTADDSTLVELYCAAAKGKDRRSMHPFTSFTHCEGFLGDAGVWLSELFVFSRGKLHIVPAFDSCRAGRIFHASAWRDEPISAAHWATTEEDLLSLPPLRATPAQLRKSGWNVHASHGLPACVVRTFLQRSLFSASEFHESC